LSGVAARALLNADVVRRRGAVAVDGHRLDDSFAFSVRVAGGDIALIQLATAGLAEGSHPSAHALSAAGARVGVLGAAGQARGGAHIVDAVVVALAANSVVHPLLTARIGAGAFEGPVAEGASDSGVRGALLLRSEHDTVLVAGGKGAVPVAPVRASEAAVERREGADLEDARVVTVVPLAERVGVAGQRVGPLAGLALAGIRRRVPHAPAIRDADIGPGRDAAAVSAGAVLAEPFAAGVGVACKACAVAELALLGACIVHNFALDVEVAIGNGGHGANHRANTK